MKLLDASPLTFATNATTVLRAALIDPDCRSGKHTSCVGGPWCECECHGPLLPEPESDPSKALPEPAPYADPDHKQDDEA